MWALSSLRAACQHTATAIDGTKPILATKKKKKKSHRFQGETKASSFSSSPENPPPHN